MSNTVALVTNQSHSDRIITAAKEVADRTNTDLVVVGVMDNNYEMDPKVVDYLFSRSKEKGGTMQLYFRKDTFQALEEIVDSHDCRQIITGMPSSNQSVVYHLWKTFPEKSFHTVDSSGQVVDVAPAPMVTPVFTY